MHGVTMNKKIVDYEFKQHKSLLEKIYQSL